MRRRFVSVVIPSHVGLGVSMETFFWIPVEDSFKKAFVEEWVVISDVPSEGSSTAEVPMIHDTVNTSL